VNVDKAGPVLLVYAVACIVLVADMLFLWVYSGVVRARVGIAINPEDAARFGVPLSEIDSPQVARVLQAHANAQATIFPFLALALAFVLIGGSLPSALILFSTFTAARIAHTAAYLRSEQPWRTLSFIVGGLTTIVLIVLLVWRVAFVAMGS
jgi:microsomal prostaglandin-E synthase 1